ncbi:MAG: GH32 C-terminal domain-containing protein [Bacilli bacterium]
MMITKKLLTIFFLLFIVSSLYACGKSDPYTKDLLLHLTFDEGQGNKVNDASKNEAPATVAYVFTNPSFMENPEDPQWRATGINNGSLLFDGYSNFIRYQEEDLKIRGSKLSISVWIAPRAFEWDDPNAKDNGTDKLTAIVSQHNKSENQGFILGYQRHGSWSFQVGLGDRWLTLWDEGNPLKKYEWNHIVATFDGDQGEMAIYLNGELVNIDYFFEGATIMGASGEPFLIARNSYPGSNATATLNMVSGLIDELKVYEASLQANDVKQVYESKTVPEIAFEDIWLQNILTDDFYKTQYHGGPYQHWMNEPHAPMYYNGYYHLFFQFNMFGPYFRNIGWGHLISDDMVNWRPLKEVITPTADSVCPDGVWSGGVTYDNEGIPVLLFTAGNDSYQKDGLISNQNIGIARPKDPTDPYLTEWVIDDELAIKQVAGQGASGQFRDAHVWQEEDTWFLLIGSSSTKINTGGTALLYTTKDDSFNNWTYKGQLYEQVNQPADLGPVWELPIMLPVTNESKTITKYMLIISPAPADSADNDIYYWLGTFDKTAGRFIPDPAFGTTPRLLDYGNNVFTGPSGFIDPVSQKTYLFSIMQDQRKPSDVYLSGWANCVGLAREVYLNSDGTDLMIRPVSALEDYYQETLVTMSNKSISEANTLLTDVKGDMLYIHVEFENINATLFGIKVRKNATTLEETTLYFNETLKTLGVKTGLSGALSDNQNISGNFYGSFVLDNNILVMDIYLDRSLIEAFFNNEKAISARIYPDPSSLGLLLFSENGEVNINQMTVKTMKSIYEEVTLDEE